MEELITGAKIEFRRDEVQFGVDANGNPQAEKEVDKEQRLAEHDSVWPPKELGYLWEFFKDLTDWREASFGVGAISHLEIECFSRLMQMDPPISPFEVSIIRTLCREFRMFHHEKTDKNKSDSGTPIADSLRRVKGG